MVWFSYHGGHSGEFCGHAKGQLAAVVAAAVEAGFSTYGLSEHAPRYRREHLYPEEQNLTPEDLVELFRRDVQTDGRHATVEFGASLDDDLARRDFTINAIAVSPSTGEIRDPFGGRADLERRVVRAVGTPDERMREDRLRALRAIRFAARLGFAIDGETWQAIVRSAPHLTRLSRERVKQEIEKTVEQVRCPSQAFALWRSSGALASLVPALDAQRPVAFESADHIPLPDATRRPERFDVRRVNRILALFLDVPAPRVRAALQDLRFSNADVRTMTRLAELWTAQFAHVSEAMLVAGAGLSDAVIRGWAATTGRTQLPAFLRLAASRWAALREVGQPAPTSKSVRAIYRRAQNFQRLRCPSFLS